jgi:hypothetical protein
LKENQPKQLNISTSDNNTTAQANISGNPDIGSDGNEVEESSQHVSQRAKGRRKVAWVVLSFFAVFLLDGIGLSVYYLTTSDVGRTDPP